MTEPTPMPAMNAKWEVWRDYALDRGVPVDELMDPTAGTQRMTRTQIQERLMPPQTPDQDSPAPQAAPAGQEPPTALQDVDLEVPVHRAWVAVMRDVLAIAKNQRTDTGRRSMDFNFRGVDAVVNAVGPVLRRHGVIVLPGKVLELREERYTTSNDRAMHGVTVTVEYVVIGPQGDTLTLQTIGEAADAGDKAVSKAQSVAYRVMFLQGLAIPTTEPDPDNEVHERATQQPDVPRDERGRPIDMNDEEAVNAERRRRREADPRKEGWDAIKARGAEANLSADDIRADFRHRMGKEIDGSDTSIADLEVYYAKMRQAPDETPAGGA